MESYGSHSMHAEILQEEAALHGWDIQDLWTVMMREDDEQANALETEWRDEYEWEGQYE